MNGLRKRLPPGREVLMVFAVCLFPVFGWSLIWFFQNVPGWLPYLGIWDILSILAYALAFGLVESAVVLLFVLLLAAVMPRRWLRTQFAVQGSVLVLGATFWAVIFQFIFEAVILFWSPVEFVLWFGLALVSVVLGCVLARRSVRVGRAISGLAERLTVFVYLYVPLGVAGMVVVAARNLL